MIKNTHITVVLLFMIIYLIKTFLLLLNKNEALQRFTKITRIPEMAISLLFLATGIYLMTTLPEINTLLIIKIGMVLASIPIAIVGFKKANKVLASLAMVLILSAYGLAEASHKKMMSPVKEPESNLDGKLIYQNQCLKCHGEDGRAGKANSADLSLSALSDQDVISVLTNGKGQMPSFHEYLNDPQLNSLTQYLKTLRK